VDCLVLIFRALGTPTAAACPGLARLPHFHPAFPRWPPRPPSSLVGAGAGEAVRGLLDGMLRLDPARRVAARTVRNTLLAAAATASPPPLSTGPRLSEAPPLAVCGGCAAGGAAEAAQRVGPGPVDPET
jgi:hypothetical protein